MAFRCVCYRVEQRNLKKKETNYIGMKRDRVVFLLACVGAILLFYGHKMVMPQAGRVEASVSAHSDALAEDGVTATKRRSLRRAVSESPDNLLYMNGQEVLAILKQPEMVRRDAPTTVWQYRNESCVMDVYFTTADESAKQAPVVHYEIRSRMGGMFDDAVEKAACVRAFVRAHSGLHLFNLQAFYK